MSKTDVVLIVAIWGSLGAVCGPAVRRHWQANHTPPAPETASGSDRFFQPGVIFYTTGANLVLDTNSCVLPCSSVIPTGK
ncbi:MAG TPA: hypothetical protein VFF73_31805 [Planctomycetota bacterium]|nr:hypothetical protein [Planctomycetota bacterium]